MASLVNNPDAFKLYDIAVKYVHMFALIGSSLTLEKACREQRLVA